MSKKIGSIILSICLLMLPAMKYTQPTIAYYDPLLVVNVTGYNLTAGDENGMNISIQNINEDFAYDVKASLTVPSTVSGISIVKDSYARFDVIHYKEIVWMHPILYVSCDCPLDAYSLTLELEYTDTSDVMYVDDVQIGVVVDAIKPTEVDLSVDVEDYHVTAGTENEINITVTNIGEEAVYDVEAVLISTSASIVILRELSYLFEEIDVGDRVDFRPLLAISQDIPLGAYSLTLTLDYKDSKGVAYHDEVTVGLFVNSVFSHRLTFKAEVKRHNITAGIENEIEVVLTNTGDTSVYDVDLRLTSASSQIVVLKETGCTFDVIGINASVHFTPVLGVSKSASFGAYSLTLTLNYKDPDGISYTDSLVVGVFVDSVFSHTFAFKAQVEGYRITAGAENRMKVMLSNVGDTAVLDVNVQLSSTTSYISVLKEISNTFHIIETNQSVYFTPTLGVSRNTPLGAYSLSLTLKYKDPDGVSYSDSLVIGLLVDSVEPTERTRIVVQNFQLTPTNVFPGDELTVEMELKNWGANAYDVQVQLSIDSQSPFVSLDPTLVFVGDLGPNQTAKAIYKLSISGDADASLYVLQLAISYYDVDDQSNSLTEAISISVHSIVNFRLLDIQPSIVTGELGETVTIEADLLLLGTETVDFVEVEIVENPSIGPFLTIPESYEYIGRVDPDSPVLFTIQFMVDPNATSGSYTLQVRVSCWDGYNQQRQAVIELPVVVNEFSNQNEETSPTLWEIIWTIIRILFGLKP